jgi:hypothetical protein
MGDVGLRIGHWALGIGKLGEIRPRRLALAWTFQLRFFTHWDPGAAVVPRRVERRAGLGLRLRLKLGFGAD